MSKYSAIIRKIILDLALSNLPPLDQRIYNPQGKYKGERGGRFDVMEAGTAHHAVATNKEKIKKNLEGHMQSDPTGAKKANVHKALGHLEHPVGRLTQAQVMAVLEAHKAVMGMKGKNTEEKKPEEKKPEPKQGGYTPKYKSDHDEEENPADKKLPPNTTVTNKGAAGKSDQDEIDKQELQAEAKEKGNLVKKALSDNKYKARVLTPIFGPRVIRLRFDGINENNAKRAYADIKKHLALDETDGVTIGTDEGAVYIDVPRKKWKGCDVSDLKPEEVKTSSGNKFNLGMTVDGKAHTMDLDMSPHILVAGGTRSGKSVLLQSMMTGIAMSADSGKVKFTLVDPKGTSFEGSMEEKFQKHGLLTGPSIKLDTQASLKAMLDFASELEERKRIFAQVQKDTNYKDALKIDQFNKLVDNPIPRRVFVMDEFETMRGQLTKEDRDKFDKAISFVGTNGAAFGFNLLLATQSPTAKNIPANVRSGLYKVALRLQNRESSEAILGTPNATKLKGQGDMLTQDGERLQAPSTSARDWKALDQHIKDTKKKEISPLFS